jgi:NADP-dependent 3-hydroxy acid dehydrogenase YdfG
MNKVAFITGATGGIGHAVGQELLAQDYKVVSIDIDSVNQNSDTVLSIKCDVTKLGEIQDAVAQCMKKFGRIDILFNAAGRSHLGTVEELSQQALQDVYNVNVLGTFNVCQTVLPVMKNQKAGHIFNMGSMRGLQCAPGKAAYCMSKFAVRGFSKTLTLETRDMGIRVTCINPGFVQTDLIRHRIANEKLQPSDLVQPKDIAQTVLWILSLSPGAEVEEVTLGRLW